MTRPVIIEKLTRELQSDITTEPQVVYILVGVRKLIELAGEVVIPPDLADFKAYESATKFGWSPSETSPIRKYRALDFYCSWALHVNMSREGARRILMHFDEAHPLLAGGKRLHQLPDELRRQIEDITKLERFEEEMRTFLSSNGLPTKLVDKPAEWVNFLYLYSGVIEDCPLTLKSDKDLNHITSVSVRKETAQKQLEHGNQQYVLWRITWTCHGKDGKTGDIDVYYTIP